MVTGDKKVSLNEVDPLFVKMLIAYEDQRFYEHFGVDFKAIARASKNLLLNRKGCIWCVYNNHAVS